MHGPSRRVAGMTGNTVLRGGHINTIMRVMRIARPMPSWSFVPFCRCAKGDAPCPMRKMLDIASGFLKFRIWRTDTAVRKAKQGHKTHRYLNSIRLRQVMSRRPPTIGTQEWDRTKYGYRCKCLVPLEHRPRCEWYAYDRLSM